jgi:NAD(P)-dependent dehydrogenase (short-subunit alcohol dehydrogenase family)
MSGSSETEFTGKRALVTGGTKGMGEAIVQRLRASGATVVTTARSAPPDLPQPDLFVGADVSSAAGTEKVISYVSSIASAASIFWSTMSEGLRRRAEASPLSPMKIGSRR